MIRFVLRKMLHNKWLVFCLLIGVVLAVGMVSSVPMFADGILNRMLTKDLEQYQQRSGIFTGRYYFKCNLDTAYKPESRLNALRYFDANMPAQIQDLGLPLLGQMTVYSVSTFRIYEGGDGVDPKSGQRRIFHIAAAENFGDFVTYTHGREPSAEIGENGAIEVAMSYASMVDKDWKLGETYEAYDGAGRIEGDLPLYFKIVGIYEVKNPSDPSWYDGGKQVTSQMMMDYSLFRRLFISGDSTFISCMEYYYAIDYHSIRISNLRDVYEKLTAQKAWLDSKRSGTSRIPVIDLIDDYGAREEQLRTMLLVLQIPILLMLAFYVFMISQLILNYERNEIAVLKSRGASRAQIVLIYLVESTVLGVCALFLGVALGAGICRLIGASNGFLEFVSRKALHLELTPTVIMYALMTVLFSVLTMVLPAVGYSKTGIVEHKTSRVRKKIPAWRKFGLDILFLVIAFYGLYAYKMRILTMEVSGMDANAVPIDPLLFIMSTLFIMGVGLLFIRVFPYFVRLLFHLGRKLWSPVLYASFLQVGRSGGQETFLMLFLVMTLSLGLFSANAARTLNTNITDRVAYSTGADIVIKPYWYSNVVTTTDEESGGQSSSVSTASGYANANVVTYIEPDFTPYTMIDGAQSVAKVFVKDSVSTRISGKSTAVRMMAIDSADFGRTADMPNGLLPFHWNEYLNLLTYERKAALVSCEFAEEHGLSVGDTISIYWDRQASIELRIYGIVDYWPTYRPVFTGRSLYSLNTRLIICNFGYIRALSAAEPYQVWIKKAPGATSEQIYESIRKLGIAVDSLKDSSLDIVSVKNDPLIQGVNGALTMGFLVTMIVCAIGFIIYWVLSIKRRVLQFGILRAMGLSMRNVIGMLVTEQALISGSAILVGMFTGAKSSELYVPLLQIVYSAEELIPPFRIIMQRSDYMKVYLIIGFMLLVAFLVLGNLISRIKIAQALKLGED